MIAQKGNILDASTTPEELKNIIISLLSIDDKPTTQALVFALAKTEFFP